MTGVGIVVLDLDQPDMTLRCLQSLATGSRAAEAVVLVENGRTTVTLTGDPIVESLPTTVLRAGLNLGAAAGRNLGLNYLVRNTDLDVLVVLDNDVVVGPDFVERLRAEPLDRLEVVAPLVLDLASGGVWSSGGSVDRSGDMLQLSDEPGWQYGRSTVDWAPGTCLILGRDTWSAVGGFDVWLGFLYEDVEWCHRVAAAGGRIRVSARLRVDHDSHQSLGGRWSPTRLWLGVRNETVLRICVLHGTRRGTARWLGRETLHAVGDLGRGRFRWSLARIRGMAGGLWEARRRRGCSTNARPVRPVTGTWIQIGEEQ